jgi:Arm DNA-binding domain
MAVANKLTTKAVDNAKPKEKPYKLADGEGLFLLVNPGGSRLWRLKYRRGGKEKLLSFDAYPKVGLTPDAFADSFEDDMGYVDAFRLWGMSVFDDQPHLRRYLGATQMPESWQEWISSQFPLD